VHCHFFIQQARSRPATTAAQAPVPAGQGFARAAFPDAHVNMTAIQHLHVTGIDPFREVRVMFDFRALGSDRRALRVRHDLHGMRVAHGQHRDRHGRAIHIQVVNRLARAGRERHLARLETRHTHVDGSPHHPARFLDR